MNVVYAQTAVEASLVQWYNADIMDSYGLTITTLIAALLALAASGYSIVVSLRVRFWRQHFRSEAEPENLEEIIERITAKIKSLEDTRTTVEQELASINKRLSTAIQHVGLVKFDSQVDEGGNLSFALALLDAEHTGVILTSLHGRQHNRIYTKVITRGINEIPLSEEEQAALEQALFKNTH